MHMFLVIGPSSVRLESRLLTESEARHVALALQAADVRDEVRDLVAKIVGRREGQLKEMRK